MTNTGVDITIWDSRGLQPDTLDETLPVHFFDTGAFSYEMPP